MSNTRPRSIFNEQSICQACRNYEKRKRELEEICKKYKRDDSYYDCIIPVSGGKNKHHLVCIMKEEMGMNPLLITIGGPFTKTKAGIKNYRNLGETFNCDHILFDLSIDLFRCITKISFEENCDPLKFVETTVYTVSLKMAIKLGIPFVVFGENSEYEYGNIDKDNYSANETIFKMFKVIDIDFWFKRGILAKEVNAITPFLKEELDKVNPEIIFMSYFVSWSSLDNLEIAKRYGFRDLSHEWTREGCIENFEQIDSVVYMVHLWLKYPKFGFQIKFLL